LFYPQKGISLNFSKCNLESKGHKVTGTSRLYVPPLDRDNINVMVLTRKPCRTCPDGMGGGASLLLPSLWPTKTNFNASFSDVSDMVWFFSFFLFSFVKFFEEVLGQFSSSPSKGNSQGEDNSTKGNCESGDDHLLGNP